MTPRPIVEAARDVLDGIDLDPATSFEANQRVMARYCLTQNGDALSPETPWFPPRYLDEGSIGIFLNPPGGKRGLDSIPVLFWQRLIAESRDERFRGAIFVAFSIEFLQTTQSACCEALPLRFPFCVPSRRIKFDPPEGVKATSPTHANAIIYIPGREDRTPLFRTTFGRFGAVVVPR